MCAEGGYCQRGACACIEAAGAPEVQEASCGDGRDNDCDGRFDCLDADCDGACDAGVAAVPDASVPEVDAGFVDAGTITDVGVPTDADTLPDGGEVSDQGADAEVSDAGDGAAMMDASSGDQGGGVDAGETPPTSAGGCGCRVTTSASQSNALPLMGAMSVLGLMVVRRRRRVAKPNAGAWTGAGRA